MASARPSSTATSKECYAAYSASIATCKKPATERELVVLAEELASHHAIESYTQGLMDFGRHTVHAKKAGVSALSIPERVRRPTTAVASSSCHAPRARRLVPLRCASFLVLAPRRTDLPSSAARTAVSGGGLWCLPHSPISDTALDKEGMQAFVAALLSADGKAQAIAAAALIQPMARFVHGFTHFTLEADVWSLDLTEARDAPGAGAVGRAPSSAPCWHCLVPSPNCSHNSTVSDLFEGALTILS